MGIFTALRNAISRARDKKEGKNRKVTERSNLNKPLGEGVRTNEEKVFEKDYASGLFNEEVSGNVIADVLMGIPDSENVQKRNAEVQAAVIQNMAEDNAKFYIDKINAIVESAAKNGVFLKSGPEFKEWLNGETIGEEDEAVKDDKLKSDIETAVHAILPNIKVSDSYMEEFVKEVKDKLQAIYDNGFYEAKRKAQIKADNIMIDAGTDLVDAKNLLERANEVEAKFKGELFRRRAQNDIAINLTERSEIKSEASDKAIEVIANKYINEKTAEDKAKYELIKGEEISCTKIKKWDKGAISLQDIEGLLKTIKKSEYSQKARKGYTRLAEDIMKATGIKGVDGTITWGNIESYFTNVVKELKDFNKKVSKEEEQEAKTQKEKIIESYKTKTPAGEDPSTLAGMSEEDIENQLGVLENARKAAETNYKNKRNEYKAAENAVKKAYDLKEIEEDRKNKGVSIELQSEGLGYFVREDVIKTFEKNRISGKINGKDGLTESSDAKNEENLYATTAIYLVNTTSNYALDPSSVKKDESFRNMPFVGKTAEELEKIQEQLQSTVKGAFKDLEIVANIKNSKNFEKHAQTIAEALKELKDEVYATAVSIAKTEGRNDDEITKADYERASKLINGDNIEVTVAGTSKSITVNKDGNTETISDGQKIVEPVIDPNGMFNIERARRLNDIIDHTLTTTYAQQAHVYARKMINEVKIAEFDDIEKEYAKEVTEESILKSRIEKYIKRMTGEFVNTKSLLSDPDVKASELRKTFLKEVKERKSAFGDYTHGIDGRELGKADVVIIESEISKIDVEAEKAKHLKDKKDEIAQKRVENEQEILIVTAIKYQTVANGTIEAITRVAGNKITVKDEELDLTKISSFTPEQLEAVKNYLREQRNSLISESKTKEADNRKKEAQILSERAEGMESTMSLVDDIIDAQQELQERFEATNDTETSYNRSAINELFAEDGSLKDSVSDSIDKKIDERIDDAKKTAVTKDQIKDTLAILDEKRRKENEERPKTPEEDVEENVEENVEEEKKEKKEKKSLLNKFKERIEDVKAKNAEKKAKNAEEKAEEEARKSSKKSSSLSDLSLAKYGKATDAAKRFVKAQNAVKAITAMLDRRRSEEAVHEADQPLKELQPLEGTIEVNGYSQKTVEEIQKTDKTELAKDPSVMEDMNFILLTEAAVQCYTTINGYIATYNEENKRTKGRRNDILSRLTVFKKEFEEAEHVLKNCFADDKELSAKVRAEFLEAVCKGNGAIARNFRAFFEINKDGKIVFSAKIQELSEKALKGLDLSVVNSLTPEGVVGGVLKTESELNEKEKGNFAVIENCGKDAIETIEKTNKDIKEIVQKKSLKA